MANRKIKILVFGSIATASDDSPNTDKNLKLFLDKLRSLHKKAGPFDVAFGVGKCPLAQQLATEELPLPVYLHDATTVNKLDDKKEDVSSDLEAPIQLSDKLFVLRSTTFAGGVWSISVATNKPDLVVAAVPWNVRVDAEATKKHVLAKLKHTAYTGCDLLFSHEWPQGIDACLPQGSSPQTMAFDVAHVALHARARYHFCPSSSFVQSSPYTHVAAVTNTVPVLHTGRFVALAPVVVASGKSGKAAKFVHAVGIVPLHHSTPAELQQQNATALVKPCPFTDSSYEKTGNDSGKKALAGLSEASARRILEQNQQRDDGGAHGRWNLGKKRRRPDDQEVDPANTTLFLHGLHNDVSGRLQQASSGDDLLRARFQEQGLTLIRRPVANETSSFVFLEFGSHRQAAAVLRETMGMVQVAGVELTIKWGANRNDKNTVEGSHKRHRLTEAEAKNSTTLYFKLPQSAVNLSELPEVMRVWMEQTLEDALAPPGDAEGKREVTAATEPALRVQLRVPQSKEELRYGFLDFASHAAASMAVATLSGSTDGGRVLDDVAGLPSQEILGSYLHWAHAEKRDDNLVEDSSGFKFERKHFPADARTDCWFCLASEDCERHLITGVYDTCYSAMPKGPIHPGHVLLVPVKHSSEGALMDFKVAEEMEGLKNSFRDFVSTKFDMDLFVFERAIQTKRGYHTHVQCIPVPRKMGIKIHATMLAQAKKEGFHLQELSSDLGVGALLSECEGYFYAELPSSGRERPRRFLHKQMGEGRSPVPLQFGREIVAAIENKPELAHWKSCLVDAETESSLAHELRESFDKFRDS